MPQNITGSNTWVTSTTGPSAGDVKSPNDIITPVQALMNRTQFNYTNIGALQTSVSNLTSQVGSLDSQIQALTTAPQVFFNVKSYGALGDGSTNDTASVQAAFDAAYAAAGNTTNATVFFPRGTYRVDLVNIKTNVTGAGAIIKTRSNTSSNCPTVPATYNNILISNLTFDGNLGGSGPDDSYTGTYGLEVRGNNVTITNCIFQNTKQNSCRVLSCTDFKFVNNTVQAHRFSTNSSALAILGVSGALITSNVIKDFSGIGINVSSASTVFSRRIIISNNLISDNIAPTTNLVCRGISVDSCSSAVVMGNSIINISRGGASASIGIFSAWNAGLSAPSTPTATTNTTGGSIAAGTYYVKTTYVTEEGETAASIASAGIVTTGTTSTITVTGPNIGAGINNVKAINVYITPTSASPGTEIYVGQYTTGTSLLIAALPSGTASAPTTFTSARGAGILISNNQVMLKDVLSSYGVYFSGSSHGRQEFVLSIQDNQFTGGMSGVYLANPPGPVVDVVNNVFRDISLQNSTASGIISIDRASSTTDTKLNIKSNKKYNITYTSSGNLVGDIHIVSSGSGANSLNPLTISDQDDEVWYLNLRTAVKAIRISNSKIANDNTTYSIGPFFVASAGTINLDNCELTVSRTGSAAMGIGTAGAVIANISNCLFNGIVLSSNSFGTHRFKFSDCSFNNTQVQWSQGTASFFDCEVLTVPTNGFLYGSSDNVASNIVVQGGSWTSAGQPFIKKSVNNQNIRVSGVSFTGAELISGFPQTSIIVEDLLPVKTTVTTTPTSVGSVSGEVFVNLSVPAPTALTLVSANSTTKGRKLFITDERGDAATNNIVITPSTGTINNLASYTINTNGGNVTLISNPTANDWQIQSTSLVPQSSLPSVIDYNLDFDLQSGYPNSYTRSSLRRVKNAGTISKLASKHKLLAGQNSVELTQTATATRLSSESLAMRIRTLLFKIPGDFTIKPLIGTPLYNAQSGANLGSNCFDGSLSTYWTAAINGASNNGVSYIGLDLGSAKVINRVVISNPDASGFGNPVDTYFADSVSLQHSSNGSSWTTHAALLSLSQVNLGSTSFEIIGSPARRYWRILCESGIGVSSSWSVGQLQLFESSGALIGRVRDGIKTKAYKLHGNMGISGDSNFGLNQPRQAIVHPVTGEHVIFDTVNNKIKLLSYGLASNGSYINDCDNLTGVTTGGTGAGAVFAASGGVWYASSYGTSVNSEYRGASGTVDLGQSLNDFSVTASFGWTNGSAAQMGRLALDILDASNNVLGTIEIRDGSNGVTSSGAAAFVGSAGTDLNGLGSNIGSSVVSDTLDADFTISRVGSTWSFNGSSLSATATSSTTAIRKFRIRVEAYGLSGSPSPSTRANVSRIVVTGLSTTTGFYSFDSSLTVIGTGTASSVDNATASSATVNAPSAGCFSPDGTVLYWVESSGHVLRKANITIDRVGPVTRSVFSNVVTMAGASATTGNVVNATGTAARFNTPSGISINSNGSILAIADTNNHNIKLVSTVAPYAVSLLAGDSNSTPSSGSTEATGSSARFNAPQGVFWFSDSQLLITDTGNHTLRSITYPGAVTSLLAGAATTAGDTDNSTGTSARFRSPIGIVYDDLTAKLYIADSAGHRIRSVTMTAPYAVTTPFGPTTALTGTLEATGNTARFNTPRHLSLTTGGDLVIADSVNHVIRTIPMLDFSIEIFKDTAVLEGEVILAQSLTPDEEYNLSLAVEV